MDRKLSERVNAILILCKEEAERLHHSMVMPEDLMLAILRDGNNKAVELLAAMQIDLGLLKQQLEQLNVENSNVTIDDIQLSSVVNRIIRISMYFYIYKPINIFIIKSSSFGFRMFEKNTIFHFFSP